MPQFPFVGPSFKTRSKNVDAQVCTNLYLELNGPTSKSPAALLGTPGLRLWLNLAGGAIRGLLRFNSTISIAVSGGNVYKVTAGGASTLLGSIANASTPISMASNGTVVMLVTGAGGAGYSINPLAETMTQILDPDFTGADFVAYLDGYFVFNVPGTGQFRITGQYNTDIDSLDFATSEGSPDLLVSLLVDHRELWLFNETTTEVYFNSGNSDFPIERVNGAFIEFGILAKYSAAKMNNTVFWLATNEEGARVVLRAEGYSPIQVSDQGVEHALGQMATVSDAQAYTYMQEGHAFYVLNFPTERQTWVYDDTTKLWHQRAWRNPVDGSLEHHRAVCRMAFADGIVVGDRSNGNLYFFDLDHLTDNGDYIPRIRACPHLADPDYRFQQFNSLQIDMETGVGLTTGQGEDPQAMLQWSDDGGHTWSNEHWASIGRIGERKTRVRWRRLGRSRDRVFRVTITDPIKVVIIGASVDVKVLPS